jgi:hypothetical protein
MNARVLGRAAEPVMVERLSSYLEKDLIYGSYRVCSFQAVQANTFVRIDRATQVDVNATLPNVAWRANGVTPDRRRVPSKDPRGAALLVSDAATGEDTPLGADGRPRRRWERGLIQGAIHYPKERRS